MWNTEWNDDWRESLKERDYEAWIRLCECRNTMDDLKLIAQLMYSANKEEHSKEDAVLRTEEWLTDWNNQAEMILSSQQYFDLVHSIH